MLELKVCKFGNSLGIVLPDEVIDRLRTEEGSPLFLIEAPDGSYRLTPNNPSLEEKVAKTKGIIGRYHNTLRELAK